MFSHLKKLTSNEIGDGAGFIVQLYTGIFKTMQSGIILIFGN